MRADCKKCDWFVRFKMEDVDYFKDVYEVTDAKIPTIKGECIERVCMITHDTKHICYNFEKKQKPIRFSEEEEKIRQKLAESVINATVGILLIEEGLL